MKDIQTPPPEPTEEEKAAKAKEEADAKAKAEADGKPPKEEEKPPEGAPEKYEDFTVPEGYQLDEKVATEAGTLFKDLNLTQDQAQKLVDFYAAKTVEASEAPFKVYEDMRKEWRGEISSDPTLGNGEDDFKPEVKATIAKAIDSLGTIKVGDADYNLSVEFRKAMDLTGAGDNPAFVRAMYEIAKKLPQEGSHVPGRGPAPQGQGDQGRPATAAQALYPNLPSSGG